jgi:peptidoglycan/xylan/chitin deacetylase (PgdA/CDA1 family)
MAARAIRPAGAAWLRPRLEQIQLQTGRRVRTAHPDGERVKIELGDGTVTVVDHLLFGTGYRVDIARYGFLDPSLVLTHDVETDVGFADIELLRGAERRHGCRSSWNLVGERYRADPETVRRVQDEGCEIGVHGLRHDGRDLGSRRLLEQRLPAMRRYAAEWGAVSFRSPATQRLPTGARPAESPSRRPTLQRRNTGTALVDHVPLESLATAVSDHYAIDTTDAPAPRSPQPVIGRAVVPRKLDASPSAIGSGDVCAAVDLERHCESVRIAGCCPP